MAESTSILKIVLWVAFGLEALAIDKCTCKEQAGSAPTGAAPKEFMVLTREFFATFTDKEIIDPKTHAQASIAFTRDSREEVDEVLAKGLSAGGVEPRPAQDYGFMYSRDLEDPDGNILGFLFMEPAAVEKGPEAFMAEQGSRSTPSA